MGLKPKCNFHQLPHTTKEYMANHQGHVPTQALLVKCFLTPPIILTIIQSTSTPPGANNSIDRIRQCNEAWWQKWKASSNWLWRNCDFMSHLIKALNLMTKLDQTQQKGVLDNFMKKQSWTLNLTINLPSSQLMTLSQLPIDATNPTKTITSHTTPFLQEFWYRRTLSPHAHHNTTQWCPTKETYTIPDNDMPRLPHMESISIPPISYLWCIEHVWFTQT